MDDRSEGLSDLDRALMQALDVDVSPGFVARVRQRIADEPMPAPFLREWRFALPAAAAIVAVIGISVATHSTDTRSAQRPLSSQPLSLDELRPVDVLAHRVVRFVDSPAAVAVALTPAPARIAADKQPDVLVPREQIELYRRLIAAAQAVPSAVVVSSPRETVSVLQISDLTIDPIRIEPIIAPPDGAEGVRR